MITLEFAQFVTSKLVDFIAIIFVNIGVFYAGWLFIKSFIYSSTKK